MYKYLKLALVLAVGMSALPAAGQETPKVEVSGEYSYVRANLVTPGGCCFSMNGGRGSIAYNASSWFGLVAEVGGYHSGNVKSTTADLTVITYLFGPQFSYRKSERFTPFAHALVGGGHAGGTLYTGTGGAPGLGPNSAFAMVSGGGLDVKVSPHVAVRLIEADYMYTRFLNSINDHQNHLRVSAGIVFRFGER